MIQADAALNWKLGDPRRFARRSRRHQHRDHFRAQGSACRSGEHGPLRRSATDQPMDVRRGWIGVSGQRFRLAPPRGSAASTAARCSSPRCRRAVRRKRGDRDIIVEFGAPVASVDDLHRLLPRTSESSHHQHHCGSGRTAPVFPIIPSKTVRIRRLCASCPCAYVQSVACRQQGG